MEKKSPLCSRKFWIALIGVVVPILNKLLKLELSETQLIAIIVPIVGYMFAQGSVDKEEIKANGGNKAVKM